MMGVETLLNTEQAARIAGVSFSGMHDLVARGLCRPTRIDDYRGRGVWKWDLLDVFILRLTLELRRKAVHARAVQKAARHLRRVGLDGIAGKPFLVIDGTRAWAVADGATITPGVGRTVQVTDLRPGLARMQRVAEEVLRDREKEAIPA